MLLRVFFFLSLSSLFFTNANSQDLLPIRTMVHNEIREWNTAFDPLFMLVINDRSDLIVFDTLTKLKSCFDGQESFEIVQYSCRLHPLLYKPNQKQNLLNFVMIKYLGTYYPLLGFSKCKANSFLDRTGVSLKFLKTSLNEATKNTEFYTDSKNLSRSLKKNAAFYQGKISLLSEFDIQLFLVLILPKNTNKFVV